MAPDPFCQKRCPTLSAQALKKRHSTTEEALRLAARMGAYRVILTHFSNRYPKARACCPCGPAMLTMWISPASDACFIRRPGDWCGCHVR